VRKNLCLQATRLTSADYPRLYVLCSVEWSSVVSSPSPCLREAPDFSAKKIKKYCEKFEIFVWARKIYIDIFIMFINSY